MVTIPRPHPTKILQLGNSALPPLNSSIIVIWYFFNDIISCLKIVEFFFKKCLLLSPSKNHLFDMGHFFWSFELNISIQTWALVYTFRGKFSLKVSIVLFVPPGICRNCRKSVLESSVSSVAAITSTDMEEGAARATPLADIESLSRTLGHVTLVWTIIL